jgi:predicted 3-demethylubiquinone-9 3-methyltransferase (glyoxalase superfamily)
MQQMPRRGYVETAAGYVRSIQSLSREILSGEIEHRGDSVVQHEFGFTPAFSLFVECDSEDDIRRLTSALSDGGKMLMPLDAYGFSRQFARITDRYGVSWQPNLDSVRA